MNGVPKFKELLFARVYILEQFLKRTLREKDLFDALQAFPNYLVLLQCAIEYYYHTGEFSRSLNYVEYALKLNPPSDSGIIITGFKI